MEDKGTSTFDQGERPLGGLFLDAQAVFTDFTPVTDCATLAAASFCAWLDTKPESWTTPPRVSTLMSPPLVASSSISADLTLAVMAESSIAPPVVCDAVLDHQVVLDALDALDGLGDRLGLSLFLGVVDEAVQLDDALV